MADPKEILTRLREQTNKAIPGPWKADGGFVTSLSGNGETIVECSDPEPFDIDNAKHIASSRTTVPALLDTFEEVLRIHRDGGESQGYLDDGHYGDIPHCCTECGSLGEYGVPYPCPTVTAITTTLERLDHA